VRKLCDEYLSVSVEVAADVLGMSRSSAYDAIKRGTFPAAVIKPSQRGWFVPTAGLLRILELDEVATP
jgi:hypothetical protein